MFLWVHWSSPLMLPLITVYNLRGRDCEFLFICLMKSTLPFNSSGFACLGTGWEPQRQCRGLQPQAHWGWFRRLGAAASKLFSEFSPLTVAVPVWWQSAAACSAPLKPLWGCAKPGQVGRWLIIRRKGWKESIGFADVSTKPTVQHITPSSSEDINNGRLINWLFELWDTIIGYSIHPHISGIALQERQERYVLPDVIALYHLTSKLVIMFNKFTIIYKEHSEKINVF